MSRPLISLLIALVFYGSAFAQTGGPARAEAHSGGDPAIRDFTVTPDRPAPGTTVDFTVFFENRGDAAVNDVEVTVNYNENIVGDIQLGNPENCRNTELAVLCAFDQLAAGQTASVGFTGTVLATSQPGTLESTPVRIEADSNSNTENDEAVQTFTVGGVTAGSVLPIEAMESGGLALEEPSQNQGVALFDIGEAVNWRADGLTTAGLKFMIRGKEALAWALGINESGFDSPAIRANYLKVLTVVNSLFIIALLAIAVMWMFSLLIPRRTLQSTVIIFGLAVLFVNFAFPLNRLLISGAEILQTTFLGDTDIGQIAQTPDYTDPLAVGYVDDTNFADDRTSLAINLPEMADGETAADGAVLGRLKTDFNVPVFDGTITTQDGEGNGIENNIQLRSLGQETVVTLNADQTLEFISPKTFNPNREQLWFAFGMMVLTGIAYFAIALLFVARIVVLWGLLIVSPALFLLAVFHTTRTVFYHWLSLYGRWLLIGPLLALGITVVVEIWQAIGLPITSTYEGTHTFGLFSNIGFYLPGSQAVNQLGNTRQMMEYMLFLVMLYFPIGLALVLTREKLWQGMAVTVAGAHERATGRLRAEQPAIATTETRETTERRIPAPAFREFVGNQLSKLTGTAVPGGLRLSAPEAGPRPVEAATSFLPQHLALTPMRDMLKLAGAEEGSRHGRQQATERLANPDMITNRREREQVTAVRNEIEKRSTQGDADAARLMTEINQISNAVTTPGAGTSVTEVRPAVTPTVDLTVKQERKTEGQTVKPTEQLTTPVEAEPSSADDTENSEMEDVAKKTEEGESPEGAGVDDSEGAIGQSRLQNLGLIVMGVLLPQLTHAQTATPLGEVSTFGEFVSLLWSYGSQVIIVMAILLIVLGGLFYVTSAGNQERIDQGKQLVFGSLIAILIVIFSGVLIRTLHRPAEGTTAALSDVPRVINNATAILVSVIGAFTVLMLVYAGLQYIMAKGDTDKLAKANAALRYAVYGLVVGVLAFTVVRTVVNYFV